MVFHYLTFTFTFLFFETGSHSCSLDGCETCKASEACFEPTALLLASPPARYQAEWFRDSYKATKQRSCGGSNLKTGWFWHLSASLLACLPMWSCRICCRMPFTTAGNAISTSPVSFVSWLITWVCVHPSGFGSQRNFFACHFEHLPKKEGTFGTLSTDSCSVAWTADVTYTSPILLSWSQCGKSLWSLGFIPTVTVQGYAVAGLYFEQCSEFVFWGVQSKQLICHLEKSGCNLKKEQIVTLGKKRMTYQGG